MSDHLQTIDGPYLRDLLTQPQAMMDTAAALARQPAGPDVPPRGARLVLTGMGSSFHALYPLYLRLIRDGRSVTMVETAELIHAQAALLRGPVVVVAVSQSGRSAEMLTLLDLLAQQGGQAYVIGVTNTAGSPLATRADYLVLTAAGEESTVSCKTYLSTLLALEWLADGLCGGDAIRVLAEANDTAKDVEAYFANLASHLPTVIQRLQGVRHLFLAGRGGSLAAVGTGALILKESTRFHAEGMSVPAFRHGPIEMVTREVFVLVFRGDDATAALNQKLVTDVIAIGGKAALVSPDAQPAAFRITTRSRRLRPVVEMLPVQMISLALAAMTGRQPGVFEHATKVTVVE